MILVQNTALSSTFDFWRNRTNEMSNYFTTCVVTTDANGSTSATTGNAAITGNFTATLSFIAGNTTVNTVANSTSFTISNTSVSTTIAGPTASQYGNNFHLASNGAWTFVSVSNGQVQHSGNNLFGVDAFPMANFNGAEYLLSVKDNTVNNYYTSKVLVTHDTTNPYITEYASFVTNNNIGVFTAGANLTHVILYFTNYASSLTANCTVKYVRTVV